MACKCHKSDKCLLWHASATNLTNVNFIVACKCHKSDKCWLYCGMQVPQIWQMLTLLWHASATNLTNVNFIVACKCHKSDKSRPNYGMQVPDKTFVKPLSHKTGSVEGSRARVPRVNPFPAKEGVLLMQIHPQRDTQTGWTNAKDSGFRTLFLLSMHGQSEFKQEVQWCLCGWREMFHHGHH